MKDYAVRIDRKTVEKIKPIADSNRRTIKGQIQVILEQFIKDIAAARRA